MATETATQAYRRNTDQASSQIQELLELLKAHDAKQEACPNDWGFVGDLMRLNESLAGAIRALRIR